MDRRMPFLALAMLVAPLDARAWSPGDTRGITLEFGGISRTYNVHVPASYDGTTAVPLVLDFHGYGGNGAIQQAFSGFDVLSESVGFIVAYPDGYGPVGQGSWNVGFCCGPALADQIDDVGFARALVADIERQANIDPVRVYATGHSNGAALTHRLACEAGDVFAAFTPVAFPLPITPPSECRPYRPVPILHFAGLTDETLPYGGGPTGPFPELSVVSAAESFASWTAIDRCGSGPPEIVEDLGNGASCATHTACGDGVEVGLCSIHGTLFLGHIIYENSDGVDVTQRAWDFMSRFTVPFCPPTPSDTCRAARKASLKIDAGKLRWEWASRATVPRDEFGDPTAATAYALCLYDAEGLAMTAIAPPRRTCPRRRKGDRPCWTSRPGGASYRDRAGTPHGLLSALLKVRDDRHAKVELEGGGANLPLPPLPLSTPVRAQLRRLDTGGCWDATYPTARTNTTTTFKATAD